MRVESEESKPGEPPSLYFGDQRKVQPQYEGPKWRRQPIRGKESHKWRGEAECDGSLRFLQALLQCIAARIGLMLEKRGLIERDIENAWLSADVAFAGPLDDLIGHSITYRIAVGPRAGQKVFTLQSVPAQGEGEGRNGAAQAGGFSLHAGLDIEIGQHAKLERLCRYVSRAPVSADRLALSSSRQVRYTLKIPYCDGTTHIVLEALDFMARLAALVPHRGCI